LRGNQDHDKCPRCGKPENTQHVAECKGKGADVTFALAVKKLDERIATLETAPHIQKAVLKRVQQWREHGDRALPRFADHDVWDTQHAVEEQDKTGWCQFILGRFGRKWSDAQQRHVDSLQKKHTERRWTVALVQKAIDVAWDMWEQQDDIEHNTMHLHAAAAALDIQVKLQLVHQKGSKGFLWQDEQFFKKSEVKVLKGEPIEMQQWFSSVLHAKRRTGQAKNDFEATMEAERMLMQRWLHQT
jgi:hypothetical protein